MNPKKFGKLANHRQEPWKRPLPPNVFTSSTLGEPVRTAFCRWRIGLDKKEQKSKRKSNADKNDGNKHIWKPRRWPRGTAENRPMGDGFKTGQWG